MIKIGMIGISDGNGHPFSFSAIINGYNNEAMKKSGWLGIYDYLNLKDESDFLLETAKITHVWTQSKKESIKISEATKIDNICDKYEDMIPYVDAVIIARDDFENHYKFAKPFLENGIKVFIDKPLSIDVEELNYFLPYLKKGQLMSCSGLKYAKEIDDLRVDIKSYDDIKLIRATVINSWEKYGIHMLDIIFDVIDFNVKSVLSVTGKHMSVILKNNDNSLIQIDAIGESSKTFQLDIWDKNHKYSTEINDNFTAFKRTLYYFIKMIKDNKPIIAPSLTINLMKILIAARISQNENREVYLNEIDI